MVDSFRELVKARVGDFTKLLGDGYVVPTHYEARHKRLLAQLVTSICNIFIDQMELDDRSPRV